ncbi:fructose-bisphosphatase class II [Amycolatopsis thermoflava]|uniref:fructose-bisphosphatase class II n=1 Tax=Amycolatopsis thermoflava TaxID=84480 RepID=UPI00380334DF
MSVQPEGEPVAGPGHRLAFELLRATEAGAVAAGRWVGHGVARSGGIAAAEAMREVLAAAPARGTVVVRAGARRGVPVLLAGEDVGHGDGPACDVAVSVADGALSTSRDVPYSLTAVAAAERGALFDPSHVTAMDKLAVGPGCAEVVDLDRPVRDNLRAVAAATGVRVGDLVVGVLSRPRHRELVREIRSAGARVHVLEGGGLAGALAVGLPDSPVDVVIGSGGAAEGVLAAAALACLGGALQVRPRYERRGAGPVLHTSDLVGGTDIVFCATGVTSSEALRGVAQRAGRTTTRSLVLCSSPASVRIVESDHGAADRYDHTRRRSA